MLLISLLFVLGVVSSKNYDTTSDGPKFSIETVGNAGNLQFNTTINNGTYLALLYYKELESYKDMLVFFGTGDGYVSDVYIGKAKLANPDADMSFNKTWNLDATNDYSTKVSLGNNTYTLSAVRKFSTNDIEDYDFTCGTT